MPLRPDLFTSAVVISLRLFWDFLFLVLTCMCMCVCHVNLCFLGVVMLSVDCLVSTSSPPFGSILVVILHALATGKSKELLASAICNEISC